MNFQVNLNQSLLSKKIDQNGSMKYFKCTILNDESIIKPFVPLISYKLITYAADITITSSHPNINTATQNLLPYLNEVHTWALNNNLQINPTKTTSTLMTPDPSEYNKPLNIHINNIPIPLLPTLPSLA